MLCLVYLVFLTMMCHFLFVLLCLFGVLYASYICMVRPFLTLVNFSFYDLAKGLVYTLDAIVILIHISSMYIPSGLLNEFFRAVPTQVLGPF